MREQAVTRLSQIIATVIESQQVTVDECATSLAQLMAFALQVLDEDEFNRAIDKLGTAVRQNRAIMQKPSAKAMN